MKTQTIPNASGYTTPQCMVHEIQPEGSLCTSMRLFFEGSDLQQLTEDDNFSYNW